MMVSFLHAYLLSWHGLAAHSRSYVYLPAGPLIAVQQFPECPRRQPSTTATLASATTTTTTTSSLNTNSCWWALLAYSCEPAAAAAAVCAVGMPAAGLLQQLLAASCLASCLPACLLACCPTGLPPHLPPDLHDPLAALCRQQLLLLQSQQRHAAACWCCCQRMSPVCCAQHHAAASWCTKAQHGQGCRLPAGWPAVASYYLEACRQLHCCAAAWRVLLASPAALPPAAGPALQPYWPYNLGGPGTCRVEGLVGPMSCGSSAGTGSTPPEQLIPIRPDLSSQPIRPGEQVVWQSAQTGKFCRVVTLAGGEQLVCDAASAAEGTPLDYSGAGGCTVRPLLAASGCFWLLLAASGCFWLRLAASG
jgi:hypothetical protein